MKATRLKFLTREEWIAAAPEKLGEASRLIASLLMAAKRLDDEDVNGACERMGEAMDAIKAAASAIGIENPPFALRSNPLEDVTNSQG